MARVPRIVAPGEEHHVTQRGNDRQQVFFDDEDYGHYLELLVKYSDRHRLSIHGYCLMPNHVHLIVVPRAKLSLAKVIGGIDQFYSQHVNRRYRRSGHLWQSRFYSCVLSPEHGYDALRYIELNPVRAKLAKRAWDYAWSSASAHVRRDGMDEILDMDWWLSLPESVGWRKQLGKPPSKDLLAQLRRQTLKGYPLGNESFLTTLHRRLQRTVKPSPVGRPEEKKN